MIDFGSPAQMRMDAGPPPTRVPGPPQPVGPGTPRTRRPGTRLRWARWTWLSGIAVGVVATALMLLRNAYSLTASGPTPETTMVIFGVMAVAISGISVAGWALQVWALSMLSSDHGWPRPVLTTLCVLIVMSDLTFAPAGLGADVTALLLGQAVLIIAATVQIHCIPSALPGPAAHGLPFSPLPGGPGYGPGYGTVVPAPTSEGPTVRMVRGTGSGSAPGGRRPWHVVVAVVLALLVLLVEAVAAFGGGIRGDVETFLEESIAKNLSASLPEGAAQDVTEEMSPIVRPTSVSCPVRTGFDVAAGSATGEECTVHVDGELMRVILRSERPGVLSFEPVDVVVLPRLVDSVRRAYADEGGEVDVVCGNGPPDRVVQSAPVGTRITCHVTDAAGGSETLTATVTDRQGHATIN